MGVELPTPSRGEGRGCHPGPTVLTIDCRGDRAAGRRERRVTGGGGGRRGGQEGRRWALTSSVLPPCSCKAFCKSSTCARSSNSCCWFSLQGCGAAECLRPPSAPTHTPPPSARSGVPSTRWVLTAAGFPARGARGWRPPGGAAAPPAAPGRPPPAGTAACSPAEAAGASPCRGRE